MADNLIEFTIYGEGTTSAYMDAKSPEENPYANYRNYGECLLNPVVSTGGTSVQVDSNYPLAQWGGSRTYLAAWLQRRNRRIWVHLDFLEYADSKRIVEYWERESGAGSLIMGYITKDEALPHEVELLRQQVRAVRDASDKPVWCNLTCSTWNTTWPLVFKMGGSRHEMYPNIISLDAYPWTFSDGYPWDRFVNRLVTGDQPIPGDPAGQTGYDWYLTKLVKYYCTMPQSVGCDLTPANGHVLGVIIQGQEQRARVRDDRNTSAFIAWATMSGAKVEQQLKYALAQTGYTSNVGESATYVRNKTIGGAQLLQIVGLYWWGSNNDALTEADWNTLGRKEMPLLASERLRGYMGYYTGLAKQYVVPGPIIFPRGHDTEVPYASLTTQVAAPRISKFGIFYKTTAEEVTLSCSTAGASIYYTTDGSVPSAGSTLYSTPLNLSSSTTIRAIAIKGGMSNSPITTGRLQFATVAPPYNLTDVRYYAVDGLLDRLTGAKIQASDNLTTWTDLHTIASEPVEGYTTQAVTVAQRWRYYRLYNSGAALVVGHVEFLNQGSVLQGATFHLAAAAGHGLALAFDGDVDTYYEASAAGGYVGIDTGAAGPGDPPPVPVPQGAKLQPGSLQLLVGDEDRVDVLNIGTRTVSSFVWSVAGVASVSTQSGAGFQVLGLASGETLLTVTLSDSSTLTLGVTVSPRVRGSGRFLSVPRPDWRRP